MVSLFKLNIYIFSPKLYFLSYFVFSSMAFLLFLYNANDIINTKKGGTTNFTGLSFIINFTGLLSPIIVHINPATNINADMMDKVKNIFFFIFSFFKLNILIHTPNCRYDYIIKTKHFQLI